MAIKTNETAPRSAVECRALLGEIEGKHQAGQMRVSMLSQERNQLSVPAAMGDAAANSRASQLNREIKEAENELALLDRARAVLRGELQTALRREADAERQLNQDVINELVASAAEHARFFDDAVADLMAAVNGLVSIRNEISSRSGPAGLPMHPFFGRIGHHSSMFLGPMSAAGLDEYVLMPRGARAFRTTLSEQLAGFLPATAGQEPAE